MRASTTTSFSFNEQFDAFKSHVNYSLKSPYRIYKGVKRSYKKITESHYYEALQPFLKSVQKLHYSAELIFNKFLPEAELTGIQKFVVEKTLFVLLGAADIASATKNFTNILKVFCLPVDIYKKFAKLQEAMTSQDPEKIWSARLNMVPLAKDIFDAPEKIYKFCDVITKFTPTLVCEWMAPLNPLVRPLVTPLANLFKQISTPFSVVSLILSIVSPIIHVRNCYSTTELVDMFDSKYSRTFIKEYSNRGELNNLNIPTELKQLSTSKLKKYVRKIEVALSDPEKVNLLREIQHKANIAYINKIHKEVNKDKNIIENQFSVVFKKTSKEEKIQKTFFDKLNSQRIQNEPARAAAIVKNLKDRLNDKVSSDKFALATKVISLVPSILSTVVTLAAFYAPALILGATLTPIASALAGVLAFALVVDIFYRHYQEQFFVESMEALTKKNPPGAPA